MIGQRGWYAFHKLLAEYEFETVLDVGAGDGIHARVFAEAGKWVAAIDQKERPGDLADVRRVQWCAGSWNGRLRRQVDGAADVVWACHVLEHAHNVSAFLAQFRRIVKPGGVLAVTVPPAKQQLVGGHLTLWTPGLLLYNLALAGFACADARLIQRGYDISCIVRPSEVPLPELAHDSGDVTRLAESGHLPKWFEDGMDGEVSDINWGDITGGQDAAG